MSTGNARAARRATLSLLDNKFKTAGHVQAFIQENIRGLELTQEQKIQNQNCFIDARSEHAWQAMNYMIRLIKENQRRTEILAKSE